MIFDLRKTAISLGLFLLIAFGSVTATKAADYTFAGSPNGNPVTATASIVQSGSLLTITLTNTTANINDVGQAITDFSFRINGVSLTATTGFTGSGRTLNVGGGGVGVDVGTSGADVITGVEGWTLASTGPGAFHLDALGTANPQYAILGPPTTGLTYSNANGSIASNGPHNPFVDNTATFSFTVTGLAAGATFTNVVMSFGTESGHDLPGTPNNPVPEPASMMLLGTGLVGAAGAIRRRRRNV